MNNGTEVRLQIDIPRLGLKKGATGVVGVPKGGDCYEVSFGSSSLVCLRGWLKATRKGKKNG